MIASNSRYVNYSQVTQTVNGKDRLYITPAAPTAFTFQYSFYVVNGSDRVDNIAATFLGDPTQWFLIAQANPQIMNWFNLTAGTIIRIPVLSVTS